MSSSFTPLRGVDLQVKHAESAGSNFLESSNAGGFMVSLEEVQWALGMGRNLPFEEAIHSSKRVVSQNDMIWVNQSAECQKQDRGMPENDRIVIKLISTSILPGYPYKYHTYHPQQGTYWNQGSSIAIPPITDYRLGMDGLSPSPSQTWSVTTCG